MGFFEKIKAGLTRTKENIGHSFDQLFAGELNDDSYDELDGTLILGDMGAAPTMKAVEELRRRVKAEKIKDMEGARACLRQVLTDMLQVGEPALKLDTTPSVALFIGVNGVGKTTTAVNLSSCVAALGKKVLIVDLDPQGNTTTGYGISKRSVDIGTYEILIGEADARQAVRKTEFRTDVIGSNTRLAGASLEMIDLPGRESRLRKALAPIQKDYDFIFIDCPPSLDLLTLNGLCACDSILIPVQCEYYALEGLSVRN